VEPAPVIVRAAAELEHALAEEVPVLARVAVRPRTKSATAAHHRDQVRHLAAEDRAVEDLAAAVGTTREPAVTEVAAAWAAVE
jgi:hypothetical protein